MSFNFDWDCVSCGAPYITVSNLGLAFNMPSIKMLNCPEYVVVGFDEKEMTIGIREATADETQRAYKFYSRIKNGWIRIGCKDFVNYLSELSGIQFSPAVRYIAKMDSQTDILYITIQSKNETRGRDD